MDGSLSQKRLFHCIMGIFKTAGTAAVEIKSGEHFYFLENHCGASARRNDVVESLYAQKTPKRHKVVNRCPYGSQVLISRITGRCCFVDGLETVAERSDGRHWGDRFFLGRIPQCPPTRRSCRNVVLLQDEARNLSKSGHLGELVQPLISRTPPYIRLIRCIDLSNAPRYTGL
jgi:hypothetical protein